MQCLVKQGFKMEKFDVVNYLNFSTTVSIRMASDEGENRKRIVMYIIYIIFCSKLLKNFRADSD